LGKLYISGDELIKLKMKILLNIFTAICLILAGIFLGYSLAPKIQGHIPIEWKQGDFAIYDVRAAETPETDVRLLIVKCNGDVLLKSYVKDALYLDPVFDRGVLFEKVGNNKRLGETICK